MQEEMRREMLRTQYEQGRKDVINTALSKYVIFDREGTSPVLKVWKLLLFFLFLDLWCPNRFLLDFLTEFC